MIERIDLSIPRESEDYHTPATVEELTRRNVETIVALERAAKENQTLTERLAGFIARFCGTMTFVVIHIIWFGGWILINSLPVIEHFDPFPFTFLTLVVSLEAIFLSTFILISQNQETRLTERRNNLDLQINLLTEQENTKMLQILKKIAEQVGATVDDDPTVSVLEQATRPEQLVEQIMQTAEQAEDILYDISEAPNVDLDEPETPETPLKLNPPDPTPPQ